MEELVGGGMGYSLVVVVVCVCLCLGGRVVVGWGMGWAEVGWGRMG